MTDNRKVNKFETDILVSWEEAKGAPGCVLACVGIVSKMSSVSRVIWNLVTTS